MIKTYPLVMSEDFHKRLKRASKKQCTSIKELIMYAITKEIEKTEVKK